jgi:DHA3 family tetracycline resistance protein-like MFS transporter
MWTAARPSTTIALMSQRDRRSSDGARRLLAPFKNAEYRMLVAALMAAVVAAGMWAVVMPMEVIELHDDPLALSLVASCYGGAAVVCALVGGVAADRLSQRRIIIVVQLLNFVAVVAVAALAVADRLQLWQLAVAAAVLGAGAGVFAPAFSAYLPRILPAEQLVAANGVDGVMRSTLQQALGPTLAGVLLGATFPTTGLVIIAVLFGVGVTVLAITRPATTAAAPDRAHPHVLADLRDGLMFVVRTPWLLATLLFAAVTVLVVAGPLEVLLPFITQEKFTDGPLAFGSVLAAVGIGAAIGAVAVSSRGLPRRYLTVMTGGAAVGMLPMVVLGNTSRFPVMAAAALVVGLVQGVGLVIRSTLLQRRVPREKLGRVASVDVFFSLALLPVSTAVTGPLSEIVPVGTIFAVAGCLPLAAAVVAIFVARMRGDEINHPLN